jgi:Mg2+ and Co2+ transporter CorA
MGDVFYGDAGFAEQTKDAWQEIKDATKGYDDDLKDLEEAAGETFEAISEGEDVSVEKARELINENQGIIDKYGDELHKVQECYDTVNKLIKAHTEEMEVAKKAAEEAYNYYSKELEMQQKAYEASEKLRTSQNAAAEASAKAAASIKTTTTTSSSSSSSSKSSSSGNSNSGGKSPSSTTKTAKTTYTITLDYNYDGKKETKKVTEGSSVTLPYASRSGYQFNG